MLPHQPPLRAEVEQRTVQRSAGEFAVPFNDPYGQNDPVLACDFTQPFGGRGRHLDGTLPVLGKYFAAPVFPYSHTSAEAESARISRDKRLGKQHELGAFLRGLGGPGRNLFDRTLRIQHSQGGLHHGGIYPRCRLRVLSDRPNHVTLVRFSA